MKERVGPLFSLIFSPKVLSSFHSSQSLLSLGSRSRPPTSMFHFLRASVLESLISVGRNLSRPSFVGPLGLISLLPGPSSSPDPSIQTVVPSGTLILALVALGLYITAADPQLALLVLPGPSFLVLRPQAKLLSTPGLSTLLLGKSGTQCLFTLHEISLSQVLVVVNLSSTFSLSNLLILEPELNSTSESNPFSTKFQI